MELFDELQQAIGDFNNFQQFITHKKAMDKQFLCRTFWVNNGSQTTVLNYLIILHTQESNNLKQHIEYILHEGADVYSSQPIHLAFEYNKMDLIPMLLGEVQELSHGKEEHSDSYEKNKLGDKIDHRVIPKLVDLNSRDHEGRTLISRAIESGNIDAIQDLLQRRPNVDQASKGVQPIHQAVKMDFTQAVEALIDANADISNPCMKKKETALLLAARHGKINALSVLLAHLKEKPHIDNPLDIENTDSLCAIELLCQRLEAKRQPKNTTRGIAMLLSHGASAPGSEKFRRLLKNNRKTLLDTIIAYTENLPQLKVKFVRAVHDKNNPLHDILYPDTTGLKYFFGIGNKMVFKFENLVSPTNQSNQPSAKSILVQNLTKRDSKLHEDFEPNEILFAEFTRRYNQSISGMIFYNPHSPMRWKLIRGEITSWKEVISYTKEHPETRSAKIVRDMNHRRMNVYAELDTTHFDDKSSNSPV